MEANLKIKTFYKELLKLKPKGESTAKRNKKTIFQHGSKTEVKSSETDSVILEDQAQHTEVGSNVFLLLLFALIFYDSHWNLRYEI